MSSFGATSSLAQLPAAVVIDGAALSATCRLFELFAAPDRDQARCPAARAQRYDGRDEKILIAGSSISSESLYSNTEWVQPNADPAYRARHSGHHQLCVAKHQPTDFGGRRMRRCDEIDGAIMRATR